MAICVDCGSEFPALPFPENDLPVRCPSCLLGSPRYLSDDDADRILAGLTSTDGDEETAVSIDVSDLSPEPSDNRTQKREP